MVYFMQSVDGGPIKIGTTRNLETRRKQLEQIYNTTLVVLATVDGDRDAERAMHERFGHLRIDRTEQFQPGADLMEFLGLPPVAADVPAQRMESVGSAQTLFAIKGLPSWYNWLKRYAEFRGVAIMNALDTALRERAKADGFTEPMPRRAAR